MNLVTALFGTRVVAPPREVPSPNPPRGRLALAERDEAPGQPRCIACGICARTCPFGCITVQAAGRREPRPFASRAKVHMGRLVPAAPLTPPPSGPVRHAPAGFLLDLTQCCRCGLCVAACPAGAIAFSRHMEPCAGLDCDAFDLLADLRGRTEQSPTQRR